MTQTLQTHTVAPSRWPLSIAGAGLLLAGPILELVSELIAPREPSGMSDVDEVAWLADHASRLTTSWVVGLPATAALAAAYVLLAVRLTERGRVVGRIAAVLGVLGAVSLAGHYAASLATVDVALSGADGAAAAVASITDGRATLVTIPFVVLGLNLAIVLIGVAAARAGWMPGWAIVLGVPALIGDFSPTNYNTVIHCVFATVLFGFIAAGLRREQ